MKPLHKLMVAVLCITFSSQLLASSTEDHTKDANSIRSLRASFNGAIANHDASSIAGYLDSDYQITTANGTHYRETPEEDAEAWAEIFEKNDDIIYVRTTEGVEVSSFLDLAAENGRWVGRWTSPRGNIEMGGSYFAQWRKVEGNWKIRAEIFVALYCNGDGCSK